MAQIISSRLSIIFSELFFDYFEVSKNILAIFRLSHGNVADDIDAG